MSGGEPLPCMKQMQMITCQICGCDMQSHPEHAPNYQKQVDPPANPYGTENLIQILPDPVPHPPEFYKNAEIPFIVHTPVIEYRVTSEVRGKPANQTGVFYIMNHGATERKDILDWVEKKKRLKKCNISWVGDGNYNEVHPEFLHFYGNTTHLFTSDPERPYGNTKPPRPVCRPRNGLD